MRTQKYIQVEGIVAKYKDLASKAVKIETKEDEFMEFYVPSDFLRVLFVPQLIGYIYQLYAGEHAIEEVVKNYKIYTQYYVKGLLSEEEEAFLVENFDVFLDYIFRKDEYPTNVFDEFSTPSEWSSLVPYLFESCPRKIFIPNSDKGNEFIGLANCEPVVESGFANAAMRAQACGMNIKKYENCKSNESLWSDLDDNSFDATIVGLSISDYSVEEVFDACFRILKDGGEMLVSLPREAVLGKENGFLVKYVSEKRMLQAAIELPSGNILFHFVKKPHDTFVMCDATALAQKSDKSVIDIAAFQKEVEMANMPEREEHPVVRRYSYGDLNSKALLPSYYLHFPTSGTPISQIAQLGSEMFFSDECSKDEKVVTVNELSKVFSKGEFHVDMLQPLKTDRMRRYYRVEGPAVIVAVSEKEIAIGYTNEKESFLVPKNLYALKPLAKLDVRFLACQMLSSTIQEQVIKLVYGKGHNATLAKYWSELVRIATPSIEEQQKYIQDAVLKDYAIQEEYVAMREKGFKHSIRLRKHALSQNISAFDSLFKSLEYCIQEHNGRIDTKYQLSPISPMTVGEAMTILRSKLTTICERIAKMTDDKDWGKCEAIEPQSFIEEYEHEHRNSNFTFEHQWEGYESNIFSKDVFDKNTGKLLFHKGESTNMAWFPKRALQQVLDNIVSNACEHGFTDKSRKDYVIQTGWATDGLNMIIHVSNNGKPMPADLDSELVLEYGYSSALNQKGHGGIGGGEIAEIMHKFGGDVEVISSPNNKLTVSYLLKMPLASIY